MPAGLGMFPLGPPFHRRVNQRLYFPPQVGLGLVLSLVTAGGPNLSWLKPFGIGLCIFYKTTLDWLVFALMSTLTKDEPELPRWIGWPAWVFSHFSQISHMLFLHSNTHQNLWNLLI